MAIRRFFYVTQDALEVWSRERSSLQKDIRFPSTDDGFAGFRGFLQSAPQTPSLMLVDVIEEEFVVDSVPKMGHRDRAALMQRRLERRFPRTHYRRTIRQGRGGEGEEVPVLHCAISNHELLDPWIDIIVGSRSPLVGIISVPMLCSRLLSRFRRQTDNAMFLTHHQGDKLRQVFMRDGHLKSARLSQAPPPDDPAYGQYIVTEISRSRKYLERARLLRGDDELHVFMIADRRTADDIVAGNDGKVPMQLHFVDPLKAKLAAGLAGELERAHQEALYLSICARWRPAFSYARRGETTYSRLLRLRNATVGTAVAASVACAIASGVLLADGLYLRDASASIRMQIDRMVETFRRENEEFRPFKATSHEMKLAVDTGDYILGNRLPVAWVMTELGRVLADHPGMQIDELSWQLDAAQPEADARRRPGDAPAPIVVPVMTAVSAEITGQVRPFDGDLRDAFRRIDRLAAALQAQTAFDSVVAVEYPIDARPQVSLSGEVAGDKHERRAQFRLRLSLSINHESG